jgi:hypothetical protein
MDRERMSFGNRSALRVRWIGGLFKEVPMFICEKAGALAGRNEGVDIENCRGVIAVCDKPAVPERKLK